MIMRYDPFHEFDRLVARATGRAEGLPVPMPMDAYRHGDTFVVQFDLPGVDPASIDVSQERNALTVTAERHWQPVEGDELLVSERQQGRFSRQLLLGDVLETGEIHATYENGVLTITIAVAERAKPRRIEVSSSTSQKTIDTKSS